MPCFIRGYSARVPRLDAIHPNRRFDAPVPDLIVAPSQLDAKIRLGMNPVQRQI